MAVTGQPKKAPAKKAPKVAAPARTSTRGRTATTSTPAVVVAEEAVVAAAARVPRPRPDRPAARAAAAMRGDVVEGEPVLAVEAAVEADIPAAAAEPGTEDEPVLTVEVPFKGRKVLVKLPSPEQLTMYRRLSRDFQDHARQDPNSISYDEALKIMDRATRLAQSVMARDYDREWLENQLMDGAIKMEECSELLRQSFALLRQEAEKAEATANRQTRRSRARLAED